MEVRARTESMTRTLLALVVLPALPSLAAGKLPSYPVATMTFRS
jgi:hypothetical protein